MMAILRFVIGAIALTTGRRLYWFLVAAAGFVLGLNLATSYLQGESDLVIILIALIAGFIGALLAIFLQHVAVAVAGFILGIYVLNTLFDIFSFSIGGLDWILYLGGGILGAILVVIVFDWALILISSLAGATLIIQAYDLQPLLTGLLFLGLLVLGIVIQAAQLPRQRARERKR